MFIMIAYNYNKIFQKKIYLTSLYYTFIQIKVLKTYYNLKKMDGGVQESDIKSTSQAQFLRYYDAILLNLPFTAILHVFVF